MAVHTSGIGASVNGTSYANPSGEASKERYTFGILASLEDEENRLERITQRTDRVTISVELSRKLANIDLLLNVEASTTTEGNVVFSAPTHYLIGSSFTPGTGGDSSPPNLAQAAMDAVIALKKIELNKARNPQEKTVITRCAYSLGASGATNATFTALLEFPIEIITLPRGGNVIEGAGWLT
jgi:hypothetical protein